MCSDSCLCIHTPGLLLSGSVFDDITKLAFTQANRVAVGEELVEHFFSVHEDVIRTRKVAHAKARGTDLEGGML